jgi:phage/plasmid primase-like uncharacterized protein
MTGTRVHDRRLCPVLLCTTTMHHIVLASIPQGEGAGKRCDRCSQHGSGPRRVQMGARTSVLHATSDIDTVIQQRFTRAPAHESTKPTTHPDRHEQEDSTTTQTPE